MGTGIVPSLGLGLVVEDKHFFDHHNCTRKYIISLIHVATVYAGLGTNIYATNAL